MEEGLTQWQKNGRNGLSKPELAGGEGFRSLAARLREKGAVAVKAASRQQGGRAGGGRRWLNKMEERLFWWREEGVRLGFRWEEDEEREQ